MKLTKVCAWCDKLIRQGSSPDAPITHGICATCLLTHFGLTKEELYRPALLAIELPDQPITKQS